jgi:hypothetical protein
MLISRRLLGVVDDEKLHGSFLRFQFWPELPLTKELFEKLFAAE